MSLVVNSNLLSVTAQRHLGVSRNEMDQAMERLSSGLRINSAMDDAAGMAISHSLMSKVGSLSKATNNGSDAISLIHLAEGALDAVSDMLTRMQELTTQSMNGTYSDTDRRNLQEEFAQLASEITRISENTKFNGISVMGKTDDIDFQIGYTSKDQISLHTQNISAETIGTVRWDNDFSKPIATLSPPDQADWVNVNSDLFVTFNENVVGFAGEEITSANISDYVTLVKNSGNGTTVAVASEMSLVNGVVTVNPTAALEVGESYTLEVKGYFDEQGYAGDTTSSTFTAMANYPGTGYMTPSTLYSAANSLNSLGTMSPPDGAQDVDKTGDLFITLSGDDLYDSAGNVLSDAEIFSRISLTSSADPATLSSGSVSAEASTGNMLAFGATDVIEFDVKVNGGAKQSISLVASSLTGYDSNTGTISATDVATALSSAIGGVTATWVSDGTDVGHFEFDTTNSATGSSIVISNVSTDAGTVKVNITAGENKVILDPDVASKIDPATSFTRTDNVVTVNPTADLVNDATYTLTFDNVWEMPASSFANGTFDLTGEENNGDGSYSIPGWTIFDQRMNLGTTSAGGFVSPDDGTYPGPSPGNDDATASTSYSHYAGSNGLVLQLGGSTVSYGVVHGPYIVSNDFVEFQEGAEISMDWLATGGGDAYDVFGYLLKDDGTTISLIDRTGTSTSGGDNGTLTHTITAGEVGNYKFVFTGGTYDLSGGTAVGATFEISNLDVANNDKQGTPADLIEGPHARTSTFVASDVIAPNTPNPGIEADFYKAAAKASVYSEPVVTDDSITIAEVDISTLQGAMDAVQVIKDAIYMVDSYRNELGAVSNRLDHTVQNLYTRIENQMAAYSRIEDADYAVESAQLARMQVLQQAGTAMLAQANASSIGVLALLK